MEQKKVLILTMTCGEGHNHIARSIATQLEKMGAITKIEDIFGTRPKRKNHFNNAYLWSCKHIPHLYDFAWRIERKIEPKNLALCPAVWETKCVAKYFANLIANFAPNTIVCVHNECGALIAWLKHKNLIDNSIKTITVMFDYVLCPNWKSNRFLDFCITPSKICHQALQKIGFKENQLACLGFPVDTKFCTIQDKQTARNKLGLDDKFTFFSIAGGNGIGNQLKLLKHILKAKGNFQVIMICGKNEKAKKQIDDYVAKHNLKNVKCFGFANNVDELMSASDVAFARGGGNGISECFCKGLPIIFRKGLIINEKDNAKIFEKLGCGFVVKKNGDVEKFCQKFLDDEQLADKMKQNIKNILISNATQNLCEFVLKN